MSTPKTAAPEANGKAVAATEKVTLLKPHTHAGQAHEAGAEIEVDAATAAWLRGAEVIAPAQDTPADKA
ncbi:hypothetical protein N5D37_11395 [Comamonas aquatica]|uniref:DUF7210 family protein n=1 Tax=Comamonas aquatica TaxID=225991 RepID=UPI00244ABF07|nr:hypothetical protein [Comamonas aquatica]MDH1766254.1 hypothetical protein [Comamonas aquatica]